MAKKSQWHYIMLSAGSQGKDLWDSWQLDNTIKEDPEAVFKKYQTHLIGTQNKWVMRLELSAITQQESEKVENFVCRLKTKARACSYSEENRDEQITFQMIKGLKWSEARRKLIEKGNNLKLEDAIKITMSHQAAVSNTSSFEQNSIDAVRRQNRPQQRNCSYCGSSHPPRKCRAYGKKCTKCGWPNHFEKMCQRENLENTESRIPKWKKGK